MHGVVMRGNTVTNSGSTNIYVSEVSDSLVEGNSTSGSGEHGIYLANGGSDNTVLRGNHCFNNAVNGIHLNGDASIGPGGDGLHKGITIEKNIIHGNAANGLDLDGIQDSVIQDNLIYGNGNHAARAFQIDASAGPQNLAFVNNTFVQGNGNAVLKLTQDLGGHSFFNNILVNDSSGTSLVVRVGTTIEEAERRLILATLEHSAGDKKKAAEMLGISLKTLYNRLNVYRAS
jgi:parallel beta-helix repeat protein